MCMPGGGTSSQPQRCVDLLTVSCGGTLDHVTRVTVHWAPCSGFWHTPKSKVSQEYRLSADRSLKREANTMILGSSPRPRQLCAWAKQNHAIVIARAPVTRRRPGSAATLLRRRFACGAQPPSSGDGSGGDSQYAYSDPVNRFLGGCAASAQSGARTLCTRAMRKHVQWRHRKFDARQRSRTAEGEGGAGHAPTPCARARPTGLSCHSSTLEKRPTSASGRALTQPAAAHRRQLPTGSARRRGGALGCRLGCAQG
jgi:hypothetical protein